MWSSTPEPNYWHLIFLWIWSMSVVFSLEEWLCTTEGRGSSLSVQFIKVSLLYKTVPVSYVITELCPLLLRWAWTFGNSSGSTWTDKETHWFFSVQRPSLSRAAKELTRFQSEWNISLLHPVFTISTKEWGIGSGFYSIRCHCKRRVGLTVVKSNSRFQWHFQGKHQADTVNPNTAGGAHTSCRWESNSWWVPGACQETAHRLLSAFPCLIATIQPDSLRLWRRVMRNVDAHGRRSRVLIFSGVSARGPHGLWVREHTALFTKVAPETPLHHLACAPCASL